MQPSTTSPPSLVAEIAGWYGMLAILAGYALNSFGVLDKDDLVYQLLNLSGATGVAWVCFRQKTWQAFWLETIWAVIAVIALVRMFV